MPRRKSERLAQALEIYAASIEENFPNSAQEAHSRLSIILKNIEENEGFTYDHASGTRGDILFFYGLDLDDQDLFWIKAENIHICRLSSHMIALDDEGNMAIYKKAGDRTFGDLISNFSRTGSRVATFSDYRVSDRNPNRSFLPPGTY